MSLSTKEFFEYGNETAGDIMFGFENTHGHERHFVNIFGDEIGYFNDETSTIEDVKRFVFKTELAKMQERCGLSVTELKQFCLEEFEIKGE